MAMDPFADLLTLQREMDRIMTKFGGQPRRTTMMEEGQSVWMPPVDVFKRDNDMIVRVELPGVSPADINVSVTGNMLTIKGDRKQERETQDNDYVMRETTYGAFERRITMPEDIDASQVRAQYRAGVLEITIPQSALTAPQPHNVSIAGPQQQGMTSGVQAGAAAQTGMAAQPPSPSPGQSTAGAGQQAESQYEQPGYGQTQPASEYVGAGGYAGRQAGAEQSTSGQGQAETQQMPPVTTQGGWVTPEQSRSTGRSTPSEQQVGTSYEYGQQQTQPEAGQTSTEATPQQQEERHRSRLGGWLHGER